MQMIPAATELGLTRRKETLRELRVTSAREGPAAHHIVILRRQPKNLVAAGPRLIKNEETLRFTQGEVAGEGSSPEPGPNEKRRPDSSGRP